MSSKDLKDTLLPLFNKPFTQDDNPFLNAVFQHPSPSTIDTQRRYTYFRATDNPFFSYPDGSFNKSGTEDYVFLLNANSWQSSVYYAKDKALPYYAEFALKLKTINAGHTLLSVRVLSPTVSFYETSWNECNRGVFPGGKSAYVEATIIEEHAILQYLADKLHDTTAEPLHMPEPKFIVKKHLLILFLGATKRKVKSNHK